MDPRLPEIRDQESLFQIIEIDRRATDPMLLRDKVPILSELGARRQTVQDALDGERVVRVDPEGETLLTGQQGVGIDPTRPSCTWARSTSSKAAWEKSLGAIGCAGLNVRGTDEQPATTVSAISLATQRIMRASKRKS